eukprot:scaffold32178_cov54-Attheya_sp.AAC.3
MYTFKCPAWHLQDQLAVPVMVADNEYTTMIRGLVYLSWCFQEETNAFQAPNLKLVDWKTQLWMLNKVDSPELEEQSLASIIAYVNHFDGSLIHQCVKMVPLERRSITVVCHSGFVVWSQEKVAEVIVHLGMMEKIWAQAPYCGYLLLREYCEYCEYSKTMRYLNTSIRD